MHDAGSELHVALTSRVAGGLAFYRAERAKSRTEARAWPAMDDRAVCCFRLAWLGTRMSEVRSTISITR
jgi:cytochrome c oxidase assembly factor CtaG